ncbi:hypothetical protein ACFXPI_02600 [Streptomyces sp. NPDC059104]|uniref:hypothetical protein n=1 Tax=Streptomyces sp. NPDC059104 TaxID=3346729 RepID=UPI0036CF6FF1
MTEGPPGVLVAGLCRHCSAELAAWERSRCGCGGPLGGSQAETLYAVACSLGGPVHVRDLVRLAWHDHGHAIAETSAKVAVASDRRFCWSGAGVYALYRHGPLPGPRNLEHAGRVVLTTAGGPLTVDALDYCLKALGYRYNPASLRNAVRQSRRITLLPDGRWWHPAGEEAERTLLREVPVVPRRGFREWVELRDALAVKVATALSEREARLRTLAEPDRFGLDWGGQVSLW